MSGRHAVALALWAVLAQASAADLPASNDPRATFDKDAFSLPELASEKDSYLIIIKPQDSAKEAVKLTLPPGVSGVRVMRQALPAGPWSWSYKVSTKSLPALKLVTPEEIRLKPRDLVDGAHVLSWEPVPGASKYVLRGQSRTRTKGDDDPPWDPLEASCLASTCVQNGRGVKAIQLGAGQEAEVKVVAVDADGIELAQSPQVQVEVANTWTQAVSQAGFKLQRSENLSKATAAKPALFSYLAGQDEGNPRTSAYQAQFALIYDSPTGWRDFWPRVSLEGQLTSSGSAKASDALIARAGGYTFLWETPKAEGTELVAGLKYETERKTGTRKAMLEVAATPIYGWLGRYSINFPADGARGPSGNFVRPPAVQIAPIVNFGLDLGKTLETGSSTETGDTILRFRTNVRFDAEFNSIANLLGVRNVSGFLDGTYWRLPREDQNKSHRLGKAGLSFGLSESVSFELAYTVGREAPSFTFKRAGTAGLGVKF